MRSRNACDSDDDKGRRVLGGGLRWEARHVGAGIMMNDSATCRTCAYILHAARRIIRIRSMDGEYV